ncbi:dihydropyrimidinase [Erwinia sp. 9145]|uniref:dihydropyrimidinase n=1 Tax=Erwinia sp. 9145 TaxID=1500895 RepID=UPI0005562F9F|nr:dihydropyrimidinase [Erwinia sp. 9145]
MKTLIKGGTLVDHAGKYRQDLLIDRQKIIRRDTDITSDADMEVIDARGLLVMPGGIDVHTHFNIDVGIAQSCDDFFSGTRAAACGGTTTIIDHMGFGPDGCSLDHQLKKYHHDAAGQAVIDYSFHGVIQHIDDAILDAIPQMVHQEGISSFKFYLTYKHLLSDGDVLRLLAKLKECGALATVHPENDASIKWRLQQLTQQERGDATRHPWSRPAVCEAEAIARTLNLARLAGDVPLYIVHLSNGQGLDYVRMARAQGQPVWVETCPQYLLLDDSRYRHTEPLKYMLCPPLRPRSELDKLWVGIADGDIDTVATDHCNFPFQQRQKMASTDFTRCPNGLPGVENRMPLLFSEGVMKGRISPSRFVSLTSTQPAKLFGLWPEKGSLLPGADADLTLFDPLARSAIRHSALHDSGDYSPWEGFVCDGWPVITLSKGKVVCSHGRFIGRAGDGKFLFRKAFVNREES